MFDDFVIGVDLAVVVSQHFLLELRSIGPEIRRFLVQRATHVQASSIAVFIAKFFEKVSQRRKNLKAH